MAAKAFQVTGLRSIEECLNVNPQKIQKLIVPAGKSSPRFEEIISKAKKKKIPVETNSKIEKGVEQNLVAVLNEYEYLDLSEVISSMQKEIQSEKKPVIVALDGITDPNNIGAIVRSAAFMGIKYIVIPKDRSVLVTDTVFRIASGGLEYVNIVLVTNMVSALKELKESGFWVVGFTEHSEQRLDEVPKDIAKVIVIGNEESGIRPLVLENCDFKVGLEAKGELKSLNASVAAALSMTWAVNNS